MILQIILTHLGIKALIIEGQPNGTDWQTLHLSADGARFESANELAGLGVYEAAPKLLEKYGNKVAITLIGPSGEGNAAIGAAI